MMRLPKTALLALAVVAALVATAAAAAAPADEQAAGALRGFARRLMQFGPGSYIFDGFGGNSWRYGGWGGGWGGYGGWARAPYAPTQPNNYWLDSSADRRFDLVRNWQRPSL